MLTITQFNGRAETLIEVRLDGNLLSEVELKAGDGLRVRNFTKMLVDALVPEGSYEMKVSICPFALEYIAAIPLDKLEMAQAYINGFDGEEWPTKQWVALNGVDLLMEWNAGVGSVAYAFPQKTDELGRVTTDKSRGVRLIVPKHYLGHV